VPLVQFLGFDFVRRAEGDSRKDVRIEQRRLGRRFPPNDLLLFRYHKFRSKVRS
jgi:hypothetical protein